MDRPRRVRFDGHVYDMIGFDSVTLMVHLRSLATGLQRDVPIEAFWMVGPKAMEYWRSLRERSRLRQIDEDRQKRAREAQHGLSFVESGELSFAESGELSLGSGDLTLSEV